MTAKDYAEKYLLQELREIRTSERMNVLKELSVYEKAIIFKYSDDGYESLNEKLRESGGENIPELGMLLNECLDKLPNYYGYVYRGCELTKSELDVYILKYNNKETISEYSFLSTSKRRGIAYEYCRGKYNVMFEILCKHAKEIESIAKNSIEREVLFKNNSTFEVIRVDEPTKDSTSYFITIKEI